MFEGYFKFAGGEHFCVLTNGFCTRFKNWVKLEFGERIDGEANRHSKVRWRFGENGAMINQD